MVGEWRSVMQFERIIRVPAITDKHTRPVRACSPGFSRSDSGRLNASAAVVAILVALTGCNYFPDHHLVHPEPPAATIVTWSEVVDAGPLRIHFEWARPPGSGPFPTVLVHPEGGGTAEEMRAILWDLAEHGYLAAAADYERWIDGAYERSLFAWRSEGDAVAALDVVLASPYADTQRVGVLGFSQGGVFSLLIAAYAPDRVHAVVSYYPVTDFPRWLGAEHDNVFKRGAFSVVRWYFRRQSGADSEARFQEMLVAASPYYVAGAIRAPVLLVHGDGDTTAPVEESLRMAERLAELGGSADVLVVEGGVHIFNFRQKDLAAAAWQTTMQWLDHNLAHRDGHLEP